VFSQTNSVALNYIHPETTISSLVSDMGLLYTAFDNPLKALDRLSREISPLEPVTRQT